jgi:kinesin family protein C1
VRVFTRIRPTTDSAPAITPVDETTVRLTVDTGKVNAMTGETEVAKEHVFSFDRAFGPNTKQGEVYAEVDQLVQSALDGYKVRAPD